LYIVLALVLAAFGLLIAALTTANTLWAWISVIVSVVAAALLVTDWLRGRRRKMASAPIAGRAPPPPAPADVVVDEDEFAGDLDHDFAGGPADGRSADRHGGGRHGALDDDLDDRDYFEGAAAVEPAPPVPAVPTEEPGEEPTDAADLLVVSDLEAEVRVVDEHPRYHLTSCTWLAGRATIPIEIAEARQLGFTPCAHCGPDAHLAARHRAAR
jgi:hypothetical protein